MPKTYPLELENIGEDTYTLMSRGHHDKSDFWKKCKEEYSHFYPMGEPQHIWFKAIPAPPNSGNKCLYVEASPETKGSFPATYTSECYPEWKGTTDG